MTNVEAKKAPKVMHNPKDCTGCGLCDLMCSLYHEGEQGQALSRGELLGDRLTSDFIFYVCQQCTSAKCYDACPLKDDALCIDEATGIKYINRDACNGCGDCITACPFDPPRIKMHAEKGVALMCDLCRGRDDGPVCIEFCGFGSLSTATVNERQDDE